jgi:hypothetical protein
VLSGKRQQATAMGKPWTNLTKGLARHCLGGC